MYTCRSTVRQPLSGLELASNLFECGTTLPKEKNRYHEVCLVTRSSIMLASQFLIKSPYQTDTSLPPGSKPLQVHKQSLSKFEGILTTCHKFLGNSPSWYSHSVCMTMLNPRTQRRCLSLDRTNNIRGPRWLVRMAKFPSTLVKIK